VSVADNADLNDLAMRYARDRADQFVSDGSSARWEAEYAKGKDEFFAVLERHGLARDAKPIGVFEVYATCEFGVFGPLGQNATEFPTASEAISDANLTPQERAPVMRRKVTVNGEDFFTPWGAIPGHDRQTEGRW
jgi:hypothetical protein